VGAHTETFDISRDRSAPGFGEIAFVVVLLFLTSGAFLASLQGEDATSLGTRTGSLLTNGIWACMYILAAIFVVQHCKGSQLSLRRGWLFLAPIGIAMASLAWSDDRASTFLRCVALVGTTLQSYYLAVRFGSRRLLQILGWVGAISMVLCYIFAIFVPQIGIGTDLFEGDWLGIFPHKNSLGSNAALWFLVFLVLGASDEEEPWAARFAAAASLILVFLSHSATSLITCLFVLAIYLGRRLFWFPRWFYVTGSLGIGVLLNWGLTSESFGSVVATLGRDPSLTGRTEIWGLVWMMILDKPFLGYGYGAFWRGLDGPSEFVWRTFGMPLFYSHNGFLDLWLDVGLVGLCLFLAGFAVCFKRAVEAFKRSKRSESMWPLLFLIFLFVSNLTEGSILRVNLLPWLVYMAIALEFARVAPGPQRMRSARVEDNDTAHSSGLA
jgi:exopolysaccharide production protein ExoQ